MTNHEKPERYGDLTPEELDSIERVSVESHANTKENASATETKKPEDYDLSSYRPTAEIGAGFEQAPYVFSNQELTSIETRLKKTLKDELPDDQQDQDALIAQILNELAHRVIQRCKTEEVWRSLDAEVRTMTISAVLEDWLENRQSRSKRVQ